MTGYCLSLLSVIIIQFCVSSTDGALAALSIDFGHQYLKVALVKPGVPMEIVLNRESHRKTDAHVYLNKDERAFGDVAYNMRVRSPEQSYGFLVELLGKKFDHPLVHLYKSRFPYYNLVPDQNRGTVSFQNDDGSIYSVEELVGMIIADAKKMVSTYAGQEVKDAVITVPPFFNQAERRAMLEAAEMGGVNLIQLLNDNTAAALNYGMSRYKSFNETNSRIIVYDMGSTYTTASVIDYVVAKDKSTREKNPQLTVLGVGCDRTLGGIEATLRLRDKLAETFQNQHKNLKLDLKHNGRSMNKLFKEAERVKKVLSANAEHLAQIESFEDHDLRILVTRKEMEDLVADLVARVAKPIETALEMANMKIKDIDYVVLMGGGTRFPKIQEAIQEAVQGKELSKFINTDEAIAMGAVYQAAYRSKGFKVKKFTIKELNLYPIVVDFTKDKSPLIPNEDVSESKEETSAAPQQVRRTLFDVKSQYPQKRKMTFSKHVHDFEFHVNYGDLGFLTPDQASYFGDLNISRIFVSGVTESIKKNMAVEGTNYKGAKAHFRMDESGILQLESADMSFEKTGAAAEAEQPSTFQKLGEKLTSFFSTGKTEPEKRKEQADDETKPTEQEEAKATESSEIPKTEATNDTTAQTTNETVANETTTKEALVKPLIRDYPLSLEKSFMDIVPSTQQQMKLVKEKLKQFDRLESERLALDKARNDLESYVIDMKYKLQDDSLYIKVCKPEERDAIVQKCAELSDWIDEQGPETERKEFVSKLNEIKSLTKSVLFKVKEAEERPTAMATLDQILNYSSIFVVGMKNFTTGDDAIFTDVELSTLEKLIASTQDWLEKMKAEQKKLADSDTPKLTVQMVAEKYSELDREVKYLLNKAKFAKPKAKPAKTTQAQNETVAEDEAANKTEPAKEDVKTEGDEKKQEKSNHEKEEAEIPSLDEDPKSGEEEKHEEL